MSAEKPKRRRQRQRKGREPAAAEPTTPKQVGLRQLSRAIPTTDEFELLDKEIANVHDRAACIMMSAQVELYLQHAITFFMMRKDEPTIEKLLGRDGPLSSFYSKIILAHAMGLITDTESDDLSLVREMRNAFAHTVKPITFTTPQIAEKLLKLSQTDAIFGNIERDPSLYRAAFIYACRDISLTLIRVALPAPSSSPDTL